MTSFATASAAGRWTAASAAARLLIQLLQTIVLARLLGPEAFGAMAVVAGVLALLGALADLGLSKALIHFDSLSPDILSNLFWCALAISVAACVLLALCANLVAKAFGHAELTGILVASSLVFPIAALGQQLRTLAEKDLRFKVLALSEIVAALGGLLSGVLLALQGAGAYALVGSMLAGAAINTANAWLLMRNGWRPKRWVRGLSLRRHLRYGAYLMGDGLTNTARMQADILIAGAVASPAGVGFYTAARELSLKVANSLVNPIITRVSLPLMAGFQSDRARLKEAYLASLQMVSLINFPLYCALGWYSADVVELLYGADWQPAADFLRLFAVWGLIRCVGNPVGSLLYASGHARSAFFWNACFLVAIPPLLVVGAFFNGLVGLTWAMLLTQAFFFFVAWKVFVERACGATLAEYVGSMLPALLSALLAAACAALATSSINQPIWRLIVAGTVGGVAYGASTAVFNREAMERLLRVLPVPVWRRQ